MSVERESGNNPAAEYNVRSEIVNGVFSYTELYRLQPVLDYEQTRAAIGLNGEVITAINTENKQFLVLDLTKEPKSDEYRVLEDSTGAITAADYLLVDTDFDTATNKGLMGIYPSQDPIRLGKKHNQDRFKFPSGAADELLQISINSNDCLVIKNLTDDQPIEIIQNTSPEIWHPADISTELDYLEEKWEPIDISAELDDPEEFNAENSNELDNETERKSLLFEAYLLSDPLKGMDRGLIDDEGGLFAVFDGVGIHKKAGVAAEIAKDVCSRLSIMRNVMPTVSSAEVARSDMVQMLEEAQNEIIENTDGNTTATVARIVMESTDTFGNVPYVVWAHAGDSRLYLLRSNELVQLTQDEGVGRRLYNALGSTGVSRGNIEQSGVQELMPGDMLILTTDGITGDKPDELLEDSEIIVACRNKTPQQAANKLHEISRKTDDKTVIVVRYDG